MSQSSDFDHSTEEWEAQRELFTHYYVIEDKPLWEVKSIMENTYGFRATERQYKRRIALWNLDKNIRDSEMKAMLRLQVQRKNEQGKQSIFYIHGRPVENKKLERYVRRKGLSEADIMAWNAPVPPYITCQTPPPGTAGAQTAGSQGAGSQMGESSQSGAAGQYNTSFSSYPSSTSTYRYPSQYYPSF
ncbi:hypothetical protein M430DRAFT_276007 [Amorphotheca resinae ATCC 22711]|uniref:Clr5 domain-containing protein n=1 Tax=Amorphotheca resinae ATCC 22711 TaxID=857342 RepID=A0A2T3B1Q7_AMORE|nr:hypothetical protein M430DRAFT_276007 [Amorphotheca resinae ATCC 22711]PSS18495.1 hypothetical protein M430DRAFT_276007 [Amorphotheca resinae ATCC 22711]